jgi:hypothetical protein
VAYFTPRVGEERAADVVADARGRVVVGEGIHDADRVDLAHAFGDLPAGQPANRRGLLRGLLTCPKSQDSVR